MVAIALKLVPLIILIAAGATPGVTLRTWPDGWQGSAIAHEAVFSNP